MAGAVQHDLGHGAHSVGPFAARLVVGRLGQALQVAAVIEGVAEVEGARGVRQAGASQTGIHTLRTKLLQAGGQQFGLAVTLGGAGHGVRIVTTGDGQGAGVQTSGGSGQGLLGEAGGGRPLEPFGLGTHGRRLRDGAAQIGTANSQPQDAAEHRCRRHGPNPGHTIGARDRTRLRGMDQGRRPIQQGGKLPLGRLQNRAKWCVAVRFANRGSVNAKPSKKSP